MKVAAAPAAARTRLTMWMMDSTLLGSTLTGKAAAIPGEQIRWSFHFISSLLISSSPVLGVCVFAEEEG